MPTGEADGPAPDPQHADAPEGEGGAESGDREDNDREDGDREDGDARARSCRSRGRCPEPERVTAFRRG